MKKILLLVVLLLFTDLLFAQMAYIPQKQSIKTVLDNDENNTAAEMQRRRRGRSRRRGKSSMFALGGSLSGMKLFESGFDDKFRFGLGANSWLNLSKSNVLNVNMFYYLPLSNEVLDMKNTNSYFLFNVHYQQFLLGDNNEDFGLYALGGFGYIVNFNNTETPSLEIKARYTNLNLDLGIGSQFNLKFAFLFVEVQGSLGLMKYELPQNPSDGINVPSYINFRTGIKIPLQF